MTRRISLLIVVVAFGWIGAHMVLEEMNAAPLGVELQRSQPQREPPAEPPRQAVPRDTPPADAGTSKPEPEQRRAVPREQAPQRQPPEASRQAIPRREAPQRDGIPPRYRIVPRRHYFPPVDVRLGFYYHPYFGFYYGPYYGPYYPYPGPVAGPVRYSASAIRARVRPVETEVYVNGYYAGVADDFDGVFQRLYVPAGEHEISLRLAGYEGVTRPIYVGPGDTFDLRHDMVRLWPGVESDAPPLPRPVPEEWSAPSPDSDEGPVSPFGILALRIEPTDAQVYVDGDAWAGASGLREFVIHLPAGWHEVAVRKEGYRPFSAKLELSEGQTTRLSVRLEP